VDSADADQSGHYGREESSGEYDKSPSSLADGRPERLKQCIWERNPFIGPYRGRKWGQSQGGTSDVCLVCATRRRSEWLASHKDRDVLADREPGGSRRQMGGLVHASKFSTGVLEPRLLLFLDGPSD